MTDMHDTADLVSKALRRAWQLGQTYWQQADSEYQSHWKKADATQGTFNQLVEDTRAEILAANPSTQPAPSVPDGWKLVPIEPTKEMLESTWVDNEVMETDGHNGIRAALYRAMLAVAPEVKP